MSLYTLGLFANMYPAHEGDWRGIFIKRMVDDLENRGVKVCKAVKTDTSPLAYPDFYLRSLKLLLSEDIDIYQAQYIPHSSVLPALLHKNIPLVLRFHGDDGRIFPFQSRVNKAVIQYMLRQADYIITPSEEIKQCLIGLGAKTDAISAISSGINTGKFVPMSRDKCRENLSLPAESDICLFIGRLDPMKGIRELVQAARENPDICFVFVGAGFFPDHPANCIFTGSMNPSAIPLWINAADWTVLPSYSEGLPNVLMESLSCGVPAITSNVGGCPEVVRHMETGLIIPPRDGKVLSNAIHWMRDNSEYRRDMGKKGRIDMINRYDQNKLIERLMRIHKCLLGVK
jgi:teichuronic acid biosynthesis glycosyltransferase TuaC